MKKYKKEKSFNALLSKYRTAYFFGSTLIFSVMAFILGVVSYISISALAFSTAERTVMDCVELINGSERRLPPLINDQKYFNQIFANPRTIGVVYYVNSENQITYGYVSQSIDNDVEIYESLYEDIPIIVKENTFIRTKINDYNYLSYTTKITNQSLKRSMNTGYLKVYINIEGETNTQNQFLKIYVIVALTIIALSLVGGYFVRIESMKPLEMFVEKQTSFVSDASHELRTPLAVLQTKIENVLSQPDKTVCDVSEDLAIALNEIGRLTKLTDELLTLARNDRDNIKINYNVVNANELLMKITEPFEEIAMLSEKTFNYSGEDCLIRIDVDKFKQIMIINIDNALKYTEIGDNISVTLTCDNNNAYISIADTGIGLSDDAKKKVFDRFYRADKARSRETGGTGLGLSIAKTLVSLQKGKIDVYDNQPKGTKFVIVFPKVKNSNNK